MRKPLVAAGSRVPVGAYNGKGDKPMARRVEFVAGVLAALVALTVTAVMMALGASSWAVVLYLLVGLGGLGAGIGAYQHSLRGRKPWLAVLWVSSLGLVVMTAVFTVGIYLLPGTLAALVAAGVGTWRSVTWSETAG